LWSQARVTGIYSGDSYSTWVNQWHKELCCCTVDDGIV